MKVIYIDTETTGLKPRHLFHEIIEIALIVEINGIRTSDFHTKIKPMNIDRANPTALEINGYNEKEWEISPTFEKIASKISEIFKDADFIIGHNVKFDVEFINEHFIVLGMAPIRPRQIDTITVAYEHLVPIGLKSVSMDAIRAFLKWDTENAHTAMKDVEDVFRLWHYTNRMTPWKRFFLHCKRYFTR